MSIKIIKDKMIDFCLFGRSLSDFVKTYYYKLLKYKVGYIKDLWTIAKVEARGLLSL